jgi:hypothetical protein
MSKEVALPEWQHEIEVYKGQTIIYDEDADKFVCDMSSEDRSKTAKRGSLKDLRKEIDQFIKLNVDFKPFKFISTDSWKRVEVYQAVALRNDGTLLVKPIGSSYEGGHWNKNDLKDAFIYDDNVMKEYGDVLNEEKDLSNYIKKKKEGILKKLKPINVSKFDLK